EMQNNLTTNMVWVTYQAHVESLKLDNELQQYAQGQASIDDLIFRYQLLLSRVNLLRAGPQARALQSMDMEGEVTQAMEAIDELHGSIEGDAIGGADLA